MIFLGTEKYPAEGHYEKFLSDNGGWDNAATGEDYTYYYFEVKNEVLEKSLDIFSHFFKTPLFTADGTDREMNAVDNEFKKNLSSESRRSSQIEKSVLAAEGSRLKAFSTGNLESLKVPNIREHLIKYYEERYSSNLMSLCLVGNYSLDELEKFARENFSEVVDKDLKLDDFSKDPMYDDTTLGHIVQFIPIKESRELTLVWSRLPSIRKMWDGSPLNYVSFVLGHEGKNSLLSELVRQDLAVGLSSGPHERLQHTFSGFEIEVELTEKGMK